MAQLNYDREYNDASTVGSTLKSTGLRQPSDLEQASENLRKEVNRLEQRLGLAEPEPEVSMSSSRVDQVIQFVSQMTRKVGRVADELEKF